MNNRHIFREYDIRGVAETELNPEFVTRLGMAAGRYFIENGWNQVVIGRDNRLSSDRIFSDLARGLAQAGCTMVDLGTVITPVFYFARIHWGIDAGVMITASHNPGEYNGFKIALGPGTIFGEEIQKISRYCSELVSTDIPEGETGEIRHINPREPYMSMLKEKIRLGPKPLKIVIDCGNGTAGLFAEETFTRLGCEVIPIFCDSDGTFPHHHPDPVESENLQELIRTVQESGADLGIGFDGDGDRLGIVDDRGRIVWGDRFMVMYWREILKKHPGADCIIEVKCSQALVEEVQRLGGNPIFFKTGHSIIKAKMREIGAVFTGEMSGHMFFADEFYGFDDALYATARLLRILSHSEKSFSEMMADVPQYPATAETRVPCSDGDKFRVVGEFSERMRKLYPVIDVDGVRVLFSDGWGLARCSNTQPVIVARCEGTSEAGLREICRVMKTELERFPEIGAFEWKW